MKQEPSMDTEADPPSRSFHETSGCYFDAVPRQSRSDSSYRKVRKIDSFGSLLPTELISPNSFVRLPNLEPPTTLGFRNFWKAGDCKRRRADSAPGGVNSFRFHPTFLHSYATSHNWALGAFAELIDNALEQIPKGASYVQVDVLDDTRHGNKMLLIEDNGGGMNPKIFRHCMSLGLSDKTSSDNTIDCIGFKSSTIRLGADVILFTRSKTSTQSIGLLSYTYLRVTEKENIVVPMLDYERRGSEWKQMAHWNSKNWDANLQTILKWSPFCTEEEILHQCDLIKTHGTRIVIFNLWLDDKGNTELDFDTDPQDIQLRTANRTINNFLQANAYPSSRHHFAYKHSLRMYASILYLKPPAGFQIVLRGKQVKYHSIETDMMNVEKYSYKPHLTFSLKPSSNVLSTQIIIGFIKDAKYLIDVQGLNVYHKNRLIKPFWRPWSGSGYSGRGVIGFFEANFIKPARNKQEFENTNLLGKLELRVINLMRKYWNSKCHVIGQAPRKIIKDRPSKKRGMVQSDSCLDMKPTQEDLQQYKLPKRVNPATPECENCAAQKLELKREIQTVRDRLKEATGTIDGLLEKIKLLEKTIELGEIKNRKI